MVEFLLYYLLVATSFALMYTLRYGVQTMHIMNEFIDNEKLNRMDYGWSNFALLTGTFGTGLTMMPYVLYCVLKFDRTTLITATVNSYVEDIFGYERKK